MRWPAAWVGGAVGAWRAWRVSAAPLSCASCSCIVHVGSVSVSLCSHARVRGGVGLHERAPAAVRAPRRRPPILRSA
eukprot:14810202-Alexandrium_andersonii.AAC.1